MLSHRLLSTVVSPVSALTVFKNSCYHKINFKISENNLASNAIQRFSAFNIGCLAVTDDASKVIGVLSERDYINKVAALQKDPDTVKIKDICTYGPCFAGKDDSLDQCMNKMSAQDIRHLLVMDNHEFVGMISIKDLIKEIMRDRDEKITRLSDFNLGKGGFFGSE